MKKTKMSDAKNIVIYSFGTMFYGKEAVKQLKHDIKWAKGEIKEYEKFVKMCEKKLKNIK